MNVAEPTERLLDTVMARASVSVKAPPTEKDGPPAGLVRVTADESFRAAEPVALIVRLPTDRETPLAWLIEPLTLRTRLAALRLPTTRTFASLLRLRVARAAEAPSCKAGAVPPSVLLMKAELAGAVMLSCGVLVAIGLPCCPIVPLPVVTREMTGAVMLAPLP